MNGRDGSSLRIFSILKLPEPVEAAFHARTEFRNARSASPLAELGALHRANHRFDALLCGLGGPPLTAEAIATLPSGLQALATYSVGADHIDLEAARSRNLAVLNTPGVLAEPVADAAMFLILGAARRGTESLELLRSRAWPGWHPAQLLGVELAGKGLGIFGMGEIGRAIAVRARAFGMHVSYTNRRPVADKATRFVADARTLIAESDVLVLAAPSTSTTRCFVNARHLALAKPSLIVVNVGRGDLIVDDDLIAALADRRIYAAGLDVFNGEPRLDPRYFDLPNVFMTPHIGSSTVEACLRMADVLVTGLLELRRGGRPINRLA